MSLENLRERSWLVVTEVRAIGSWMVIPGAEWSLQEITGGEEERVEPVLFIGWRKNEEPSKRVTGVVMESGRKEYGATGAGWMSHLSVY